MPQDALTHAEQPGTSHLQTDRALAPACNKAAQPLLGRAFASLDEAVKYAHGQAAFKGLSRQSSFMLKHAQKDEFKTTEPLGAPCAPFDPEAIFSRDARGILQLPENLVLAGLYCQAETALEQLPPKESWLYENFFSPHDLLAALHHARRARPSSAGARPPALFLGTPDGALLAYQSEDSDLEQALLPEGADWRARADHYADQLLNGALPPSQFVRTLAAAGRLRVIHPSHLWNRVGEVDPIQWAAFAGAVLPELGPVFLSADDAARHAQQIIQGGTEKELGGLIFQRPDQTFVATRPLSTGQRKFDASRLYPRTETGSRVYPEGYRLYAIYRSNVSLLEMSEPNNIPAHLGALAEDERRLALKSISPDEVLATLVAQSTGVQAFYVLMSDFSLIKYLPSGSAEEELLIARLLPGPDGSEIDQELRERQLLPSGFIKLLARAQGLYVVRSSPYWGPPGKLPSDWQPYSNQRPATRPPLALGPLFDSADEAARHNNRRFDNRHGHKRISFILKHRHQSRYVASDPLEGSPALPEGFELAGIHYSTPLYPTPLPPGDEQWLYRNAVTPHDLGAALPLARKHASNTSVVPLYLGTLDGALLKYLDTQAEALLLTRQGKGTQPSVAEQVVAGHVTPMFFVRALAEAGELSVLDTSEIWSTTGRVAADWVPYRNFRRRALGPVFIRADDAARDACAQIPGRREQVFGGLILQRPDNLFVATEPWRSPTEIFDHQLIFPREVHATFFPKDHKIVGVYHSRSAQIDFYLPRDEAELYRNLFPTWDIYRAIKDRASIPHRYLAGQDGSLIRYTASGSADESVLLKDLSPPADAPLKLMDNAMQQRFGSTRAADKGALPAYARALIQAGELHVLVPGAIWRHPGIVSSISSSSEGFSGNNAREATNLAHAADFPVLSPVFIDVQDALRHALGQISERVDSQFGFIFRNNGEDQYVATAPVANAGSGFNRYRVFPENFDLLKMIGEGYDFDGVYVITATTPALETLKDDRIYRNFISARHLAQLIGTARSVCPNPRNLSRQASVNLYLSSADEALLRYKVELFPEKDETASGEVFAEDGIVTEGQLESGALTALEYVRRVAASGKLSVIRSSPLWTDQGLLAATWSASQTRSTRTERYAVGPLFTSADDAAKHTHREIVRNAGQLVVNPIYQAPNDMGYVTLEPYTHDKAVNIIRVGSQSKTQTLESDRLLVTFGSAYHLDSLHTAHPAAPLPYETDADTQWSRDFFSATDICFVTRILADLSVSPQAVYLSVGEGALLKYQPGESAAQHALCKTIPSGEESPASSLQRFELPSAEFVQKVAATGRLNVLVTDDFWQAPGPVESTWKLASPASARQPRVTRDLVPPLIGSFNIGGIGATDVIDPQRSLPVVIAALELKPRDRLDLYWGAHPDPVASHTQGSEPGPSHLTLRVDTRWIMSAPEVTVRYVLTPFPGGTPESAETRVRVKLDVPGDPDTQSATPTLNDKLELPVILPPGVIEAPEGVSVVVKRYANMSAGDSIVVSWHGRLVEHPPLSGPSDEVVVPIDPKIVSEAGNSDAILVRYEIRDGVNNWSRWSRPAFVEVGIGDPSLPAPVVPRAQGLQLNLDALEGADVQTLILRYEGMSSTQTLRLRVERETALGAALPAYSAVMPGHDSDPFVSFQVPNEQFPLIIQGQARFYYYVEAPDQPLRRSKSRSLKIIGRALNLKPPRVPVAEANGNVLDPEATGVIARVEAYAFMANGQTVTLIWIGTTAVGMEIHHQQSLPVIESGQDIDFTLPDDKVSVLAGGSVVVRYEVKTEAPEPFRSQALLLPVSTRPLELDPPKVVEAHDNVLFPLQALDGATIRVSYGMEIHDSIQAYWRGTPGNGTPALEAKPGNTSGSVDFAVPATAVSANIGRRVEVGYTVTRQGVPAPSKILPLDILPIAHEHLRAPFVREAADNLLLDLNSFTGDAHVEVRKWPHIQIGQRIWLRIEGTRSNGGPFTLTLWNAEEVSSISDLVEGLLPRADLDQLRDLSGLTFTFKVAFDGSSDESTALTFPRLSLTVRAHKRVPELIFDSSPVSLPGKIYLIPCHPQVLPAFGPGTTLQRAAGGGVPGYHYRSDDPRIAVVDGNGKVTVRGNGKTVIRVSDSAGQRKSYEVNVSGVVQCYNLGEGSSEETLRRARQKGLSIPSLDELIGIRTAYDKRWPLQSPLKRKTWSSTTKTPLALVYAVLDMTLSVVEPERPYIKITAGLGLIYEASGLGIGPALLPTCRNARSLPEAARELERPRVAAALDDGQGLLPISALEAPVPVTFPVWANPATEETYQLLWGTELLGSPMFIAPGDNPGDALSLDIPVAALTHGQHELRYRAYNTLNQTSTDSFPSLIEVDREKPGQPLLGAMAFPAQIDDGLTSAELTQLGNVLPGTIASYNGFNIGDQVTTFWAGVEGPGVQVMELKTIVIEFSRAFLASLGPDADWPVTYRIRDRAGNLSERSEAVTVKLRLVGGGRPELVFDQRPVTLSGKIYLIPSHPAVLPAFGPTTSVRRQASGGTPGYTYTSDNPAIAVVDASGLVTVRGNGSTSITVRDRGGQMKSYSLSVSGVIHCHALGLGTFANMLAKANSAHRRLPTRAELAEIHRLYASRWPLGAQREWLADTPRDTESTTSRDFGLTWSMDRATTVPPIKYYVVHLPSGKESILFDLSNAYGLGLD
ncbi:Ig-like domain-containing protein [Pseudomonas sp. FEN]|uniref:Ig-like domain-containing protein n=1 Tax=Pseudomonas sp. FEN TaxID=2767468 RepID=UPI00174CF442|nr:hypothetical protein [Pseudomonas sp. FEN]CAD5199801.1 hypothetical protein [Pseudomonas sp. FEN]